MKRSTAQAIKMKQSSAYRTQATTMPSIIAIRSLKSFPGSSQPPLAVLDALADKIISGGYSKKRNPICSSCFIARSNNGSCGCS